MESISVDLREKKNMAMKKKKEFAHQRILHLEPFFQSVTDTESTDTDSKHKHSHTAGEKSPLSRQTERISQNVTGRRGV